VAQPKPSLSALAAKVAAHASWKNTEDRTARTARARAAALAKFENEVDPYGVLPPEERRRRAEHARREHLARISLRSAKVRKMRAELARQEQVWTAEDECPAANRRSPEWKRAAADGAEQ
jgi:hypothetical protein